MALTSNKPSFGQIAWDDLLINYNNKIYPIFNSNTDMKYVYWSVNDPSKLQCFNKTQPQSTGFYQLFINDGGLATERTHEDLILSWNGNNSDLLSGEIYALHEKNKETGSKFMIVERDIDGIKTIVGTSESDEGSLLEKVSKIEQKADGIDLSVEKLEQSFADNKEMSELRENLNKSIINFNAKLGEFKSDIYTYYKDNRINEDEKNGINNHLDSINVEKSNVIKYVDIVIVLMENKGQSTEVNRLNSVKTKFINSIDNLKTYITTAISDNSIVPSEVTATIDLFAKCNFAVNDMKNVCDDIIFLGAGGKISEELAKIGIKSDEIIMSVSKNEEDIKSNLSIEKSLLQGNITDLREATGKLQKYLNDAFEDGKVSKEESDIIDLKMSDLQKEKSDIDNKYNELYDNKHISDSIKNSLKSTYLKFNNKYTEVVNKIKTIVSDGFANDSEKNQATLVINEFTSEITIIHSIMVRSMDDIQNNISKAEIDAAKNELQGNINDVDNKIGDLEGVMQNAFKDGVLSDAEKLAIKQNLQTISNEKTDVDKQYTTVYANPDLIGDAKTNLKNSYDTYISKYNALVTIVNNILNKVGNVDSTDQTKLNNGFNEYRTASGEYSKRVSEAIDSIAKKKADDAEKNANTHTNAQIKIVNDAISLKVSQDVFDKNNQTISSKFSEIKQTTDSISSQVSKKLNASDLSSKIQQSASDIQIGFNGINDRININPRSMDFTAANGNRDMLLFGGQTCIYNNMDNKFLSTIGSVVNDNNSFKGTGFLLSKHARYFTIARDASWDDVLTNRAPNPTHHFLMDFENNLLSIGVGLKASNIDMRKHSLYNVVEGNIQDVCCHGLKDFTSRRSMFRCDGYSMINDMDWTWNGKNLMNPKLYTDRFFFTNGHLAFGKNDYNNNMLNGCNWDWQAFNIVNANIFGNFGYQAVNNSNPNVFNLRAMGEGNTFDEIKIVKDSRLLRSLTPENSIPKIDVSNVRNKEEIMLDEENADLGKLVTLLIKEVKDLKIKEKELQERVAILESGN